jgi:hypothetical protein
MSDTNTQHKFLAEFLEQFGWLHDSLIYRVEFFGNLRYDLSVRISFRAQDWRDNRVARSVKLILCGVTEFRLAQRINWASFETSAGVGIAVDGERVFLDLGSPERLASGVAGEFSAVPRYRSVEDVRTSEFYLDFTDVILETHPLEDVVDDHFGAQKEALFRDVFGDPEGKPRRPPRDSRPD